MKFSANLRNGSILLAVFCLLLFFAAETKAQISSVDDTFNPLIGKASTTAPAFAVLSDDKILVWGDFQLLNGIQKSRIARLNADGSLDNSFNCSVCDISISSVFVQPDGKYLVAGIKYLSATAARLPVVYRLNSDGSRDASFNTSYNVLSNPNSTVIIYIKDVQPDGKIITDVFSVTTNQYSRQLTRLNSDGTFDTTFTNYTVGFGTTSGYAAVGKLKVLSDGKILFTVTSGLSGFTTGSLRRLNSDGTVDSTFEPPVIGDPSNRTRLSDFDFMSDGSLIIAGKFTTVNGLSRVNVAKIQPAGNVATNFTVPNIFGEGLIATNATSVKVLSNNKFLIIAAGDSGLVRPKIYRFNADGSVDNTFQFPDNVLSFSYQVDAADRIYIYGTFLENGIEVRRLARLDTNGNIEFSFALNAADAGAVRSLAAQANGKVVIVGDFTQIGSVARNKIARLNADGSVDSSFDPGTSFNSIPDKAVVQSDGKILVIGDFSTYNGVARQFIVRLNADGSFDNSFNTEVDSSIYAVAFDASGKIYIGGFFNTVNGTNQAKVARLNTDGMLDSTFNPVLSGSIATLFIQADGKIMVGGSFSGVNGFNRTNLVRLNPDGTLDTTFNAGSIPSVSMIQQSPDGKYFVLSSSSLSRRNNDGTIDGTFTSPTFPNGLSASTIYSILALPDGTLLIGGTFSSVNGVARINLARIKSSGSLDTLFLPNSPNGVVYDIKAQADGKILIGGAFTQIDNSLKFGAARLTVTTARNITPNDFDGDGRADVAVFRPSNGYWYMLRSADNSFFAVQFGQAGDQTAPADYDGDGRTDIAVFRDTVPGAGNFAYFYILNSSNNSFRYEQFGATGDRPIVGNWDTDGKADLGVYREAATAGAQSRFYYRPTSAPGTNFVTIDWGSFGDKPLTGDFDGDFKLDAAIFQPSTSKWYILRSSNNGLIQTAFGTSTDIPIPADFDGDGIANIAVFRPSTGTWYTSTSAANNYGAIPFGAAGDVPVAADYDGDGKADVAVYRPTTGAWYLQRSTQGFTGVAFGDVNDKPIPSAFIR